MKCALANDERHIEGLSKIWLGRLAAGTGSGQIEEAKNQIVEGIHLFEELGVTIHCALGFLWLGEVCAESGLKEEALPYLKKAEVMFREMGMDYWLGKARDALAKV